MDARRFDDILAALGRSASRRRALALLGGAALGGVVRRADVGAAARRKHNHRKPQTCRPGKRLAFVVVPPGGEAVVTPPLLKGQRYNLRATGFWLTNATFGNDAAAAFPLDDPFSPEFTFEGVRLGLAVDGRSPDQWGSYNTGHEYQLQVTGRGRPLTLRFTDPHPQDNSSTVEVEITCAGPAVAATPSGAPRPAGRGG
ncbi:MAG TPA: hypothetical protein VFU81_00765 [Thermomicrobiales bacterium]|nr:hypothetical protein [Thermomicrobiales bacterium]